MGAPKVDNVQSFNKNNELLRCVIERRWKCSCGATGDITRTTINRIVDSWNEHVEKVHPDYEV